MEFSLTNQLRHEFRSALGGYPDFVFSGEITALREHLPVFVYHTVEPAAFEQDLSFLADNGYQPVGMNEAVAYLHGSRSGENAVVLTFDDGRSSFWRYAYPLLQRFGMKAVLFVIPGLTSEAPAVRHNLNSVWAGHCSEQQVEAADPEDATLCTWPELREMYESGSVEIESHSLFHREVFIDSEIQGFLGPDSTFVSYLTPATPYLTLAEAGRGFEPCDYYGLPLFQSAPLHKGLPAWSLTDELKQQARTFWNELSEVERVNGAWRRSLGTRWKKIDAAQGLRRQGPADVERSLEEDIRVARDLIKKNVGAGAGDHFCLPWAVGSDVSMRALRELGCKSCSWGIIPRRKHNAAGDDAFRIGRIKSDFLWRLPGAKQRSLVHIYGAKIGRRFRGKRVF